MKFDKQSHLSYCTNIHTGEHWNELFPLLQAHVPKIKERVSPDAAFGLGLRASNNSICALRSPAELAALKQWLAQTDTYIYTVNGFPYGTFHGAKVKADVYRPDWSTRERLDYTCAIADVLAALQPPDNFGSISSVPGTFREWADPGTCKSIVSNLLRCVAHCMSLKQRTGVTIAVALEPEPACMLETVDDVLEFFTRSLYTSSSVEQLASMSNSDKNVAEKALREHLGICYDVCHAAVEFEDPLQGIQTMQQAGIPVIKLQLSSALRLTNINPLTLGALQAFDEPVYLHQVVQQQADSLQRFTDIPQAMAAHEEAKKASDDEAEWRVHFHVPVFLDSLEHFSTTQHALVSVLKAHAKTPIAPHLEVETYTWDVLPEQYRNVSVDAAIARELQWTLDTLADLEAPRSH